MIPPSGLQADVDWALEQLGQDYIDIIVLCRINPNFPVEESVNACKAIGQAQSLSTHLLIFLLSEMLRQSYAETFHSPTLVSQFTFYCLFLSPPPPPSLPISGFGQGKVHWLK